MFVFAIAAAVLALPTALGHADPNTQLEKLQHFYLRANCPHDPWHERSLVALPSSHRLGLENFTVAPTTPGLNFHLLQLANGNFALRSEGDDDEEASGSFLVALKPANGTQITGMTVLYMSKPSVGAVQNDIAACPEAFECIADQWTFDAVGDDMILHNFTFAGSDSDWEPVKDAAPEG